MTAVPEPACLALICLPPPVSGSGPVAEGLRRVLGRWLAEWQLDHAVEAGARALFLLGGGGGREANETRVAAERRGLKVREIATPHALVGALAPGEQLLVLHPQLLPSACHWWSGGTAAGVIATFPAAAGVEAGFERIDLARAWAGTLLLPGFALQRLLELPEDVEAAPALLRVALQAGVPEARLSDDMIASGAWSVLGRGVPTRLHEDRWLSRRLLPEPDDPASRRLAKWAVRRWGAQVPGARGAIPAALAAAGVLAAGGVLAAQLGVAVAGFGLIALAAVAVEVALAMALVRPPASARVQRTLPGLRLVIDLALLATGYLGIEGRWFRQLFPPLVMVLALNLPLPRAPSRLTIFRDRALVALLAGVVGSVTSVEVGAMLAAVLLLLGNLAGQRG